MNGRRYVGLLFGLGFAGVVAFAIYVNRHPPPSRALWEAVRNGDSRALRAAIRQGGNIEGRLPNGQTPLLYAVTTGRLDLVEMVLGAGALPRAPYSEHPPLRVAMESGYLDIARMLVDHGADVNTRTQGNQPVLNDAISFGARGRYLALQLIEKGADVSARAGRYGPTPLMQAVHVNDAGLVRALLLHRADVTARDHRGFTALRMAESEGRTEVARLIRSTLAP